MASRSGYLHKGIGVEHIGNGGRGNDPDLEASVGPTRPGVSANPTVRNVEDPELGASKGRGPDPRCATVCEGEGPRYCTDGFRSVERDQPTLRLQLGTDTDKGRRWAGAKPANTRGGS